MGKENEEKSEKKKRVFSDIEGLDEENLLQTREISALEAHKRKKEEEITNLAEKSDKNKK